MRADEFLAWPGDGSGRTFQLVDGEVRPVSPASSVHAIIQAELVILIALARRASGASFRIMAQGAIIPRLNASTNVRVPDILAGRQDAGRGQQTVPDPFLVIEVLSPGNQDDTRDNVQAYATLPSVQEMAVVHIVRILAEIHRRDPAGDWLPEPERVGPGERLRLTSVALDCAIEDAYRGTWLAPPGPPPPPPPGFSGQSWRGYRPRMSRRASAQAPPQNPAKSAVTAIGRCAGDSSASRSATRPPARTGVVRSP